MRKVTIGSIEKILNKLSSDDGLNAKGHVTLIKTDKLGRQTKRVGYNALSNVAKAKAVYEGGKFIGISTPYMLGKSFISNDIAELFEPVSSQYGYNLSNTPHGIYLLNLANKETTEHFIPVYSEDGSLNRDVVLGCANTNTALTGDDFYGINKPNADTNTVAGLISRSDTFFDTGKATGKVTHVATMPFLGTVADTKHVGMVAWKCASKQATFSTYAPPSCPGLTEANEIIVFNEFNGVQAYKINLDTGDSREIPTDIVRDAIGWAGNVNRFASLLFDTNKLAVMEGTTCRILQLNGDGTCTELFNQSFNYGHKYSKGIFEFNGYLYFGTAHNGTSTTATYQGRVLRVDLSDSTYATKTTVFNKDLTIFGGLPAGWELTNIFVNGYSNGKFYVTNAYLNETIVCTDIADISGTMVGSFKAGIYNFDVISTPKKSEIFIGGLAMNKQYGQYRAYTNMGDTTEYSDSRSDDGSLGLVWISYGLYSNYWTLYPLSSPIEKTAEDTLEVLYDISWSD